MNHDDSYDLQWWRIPDWAPANTRRLGGKIVVGVLYGVLIGVLLRTAFGLRFGVVGGAIFGIFCGYLVSWSKSRAPMRVGKVRLRQAFTWQTLMFGLGFGVIAGFIAGVAFGIAAGVLVMVVVGAAIGLEDALTNRDNISSSSPITSWRSDLMYGIMAGLMVTVVGGTLIGVLYGIIIKTGFVTAVVAGVTIGIAAGFLEGPWDSATWVASLAFVQLTWRWHTPMQLMRFLDDARRRGVLRTVGPVYQFRHASLQDRLASQDPNHQSSTEPAPSG